MKFNNNRKDGSTSCGLPSFRMYFDGAGVVTPFMVV